MITVSIAINGVVIAARSATNSKPDGRGGEYEYKCDDGSKIIHDPDKGAVPLAIKMLKTIKEVKE